MKAKRLIVILVPVLATIGGFLLLLSTGQESLSTNGKHSGEHEAIRGRRHQTDFQDSASNIPDFKPSSRGRSLSEQNPAATENNTQAAVRIDKLLAEINGSSLAELELLVANSDDSVIEKVLHILRNDSRTKVRAAVALVLGRFKEQNARIREALLEALKKDSDKTVKLYVIKGLQLLPFEPEIDLETRREIWRELFPNHSRMIMVKHTYSQKYSEFLPLPDVKRALIDLILDPHADGSLRAVAMGFRPREGKMDEDVLSALVEVAESDQEKADIRKTALDCLTEVASEQVTSSLLEIARNDKNTEVRVAVIQGIAHHLNRAYRNLDATDIPSAIQEIYRTDGDSEVKKACIGSLNRLLPGSKYLDFLQKVLREEQDDALKVLAIENSSASHITRHRTRYMQILEQASRDENSEQVRKAARSAIEELKSKASR